MSREEDFATMAGSGALGAGAGWGITQLAGMSAAGMVGGGSGFGMAAGPVGAIVGGLAGLALWGVVRTLIGDELAEDADHEAAPDPYTIVDGYSMCATVGCMFAVGYDRAAGRWVHVDLTDEDDED